MSTHNLFFINNKTDCISLVNPSFTFFIKTNYTPRKEENVKPVILTSSMTILSSRKLIYVTLQRPLLVKLGTKF